MKKPRLFLFYSFALWITVFACALYWGAVDSLPLDSIIQLRLPRTLFATLVGIGLVSAGLGAQVLFQEPKCDASILGISGCAALGALLGHFYHSSTGLGYRLFGAQIGAFLGIWLLRFATKHLKTPRLFIVAVGAILALCAHTSILFLLTWKELKGPPVLTSWLFWLLGDFSGIQLQDLSLPAAGIFLGFISLYRHSQALDALLLGEEKAKECGVDVTRVKRQLSFSIVWLISSCVSLGGVIYGLGLLVSLFLRQQGWTLHRQCLLLGAFWGGILVISTEALTRIVFRPNELPAGAWMTFLTSFFLFLVLPKGVKRR